jgi:hypothetical protein
MALLKDLDQQIAEAESLTREPNDTETRRQNTQLLAELLKRQDDAKEKLRELLIAEGKQFENEPRPKLRGRERFNTHTRVRMELLFTWDKRAEAERLLRVLSSERERFAALRLSGGNLDKLKEAVALGKSDFRDLLLEAGFANDGEQHQRWWPGQPM